MRFIYFIWLFIFLVLPIVFMAIKYRAILLKNSRVYFYILPIALIIPVIWDIFAINYYKVWFFPNILEIWFVGVPLEEWIFIVLFYSFTFIQTIIMSDKNV